MRGGTTLLFTHAPTSSRARRHPWGWITPMHPLTHTLHPLKHTHALALAYTPLRTQEKIQLLERLDLEQVQESVCMQKFTRRISETY